MKEIINKIYNRINIQEDIEIINNVMKEVYLNEGISTKELARRNFIPIPIATVIKKELIKVNLLRQDSGVRLDKLGKVYVEKYLGYKNLNIELHKEVLSNSSKIIDELRNELKDIFDNRPQVDVSVDQAKCLVDTAINRVLLSLKKGTLINKDILCLGDDDLISVTLAFTLKKLYDNKDNATTITIVEYDSRIIDYIDELSNEYNLNIKCIQYNLCNNLPKDLLDKYDCVFVDPPYTLSGLQLFISRAISLLKNKSELSIYLSYAHQSNEKQFEIQKLLTEMNLNIVECLKSFNKYEGAGILGNISQMYILKTTDNTQEIIDYNIDYSDKLYTYEYNETIKNYECKQCSMKHKVGAKEKIKTIEQLKEIGCKCKNSTFKLITRKDDKSDNKSSHGQHLILDIYECDSKLLNDKEYLTNMLLEAARRANASIVTSEFHQFNPYGISGVIIIEESHFTIHTWPEYNYAAIDIFTCGDTLVFDKAAEFIKEKLYSNNMKEKLIIRKLY